MIISIFANSSYFLFLHIHQKLKTEWEIKENYKYDMPANHT